ncbi:MAG: hypothetical protein ABSF90_29160 [Syntrophobacteraceae bacterium]
MNTAFDLHRFKFLEALHLLLPADPDSEKTANEKLSGFGRQGIKVNLRYAHHEKKEVMSKKVH